MANAKKLWEKGQTKQKTTPAASSGPAAAAVDNIVKNTQTAAAGQQRVSQSAVDQMLDDVQKSQYATVSEVIRAGQKPVTARPTQQSKITAGRESTTPLQKQTGSANIKDRLSRMSQVSRLGKDSTANMPLPTMTAGGALAGITTQVRPAASDTVRKLNSLAADIRSNESDLINMNRRLTALRAKANKGDASAVDSYKQLADRYNQKLESYVANIGIYNTLYRGEYRDQGIRDSYARREYAQAVKADRQATRDLGSRRMYQERQMEEEVRAPQETTLRRKGASIGAHSQRRIAGEARPDAGYTFSYEPSRMQQWGRSIYNSYVGNMKAALGAFYANSVPEGNSISGMNSEIAVSDQSKAQLRYWSNELLSSGREQTRRGEMQTKLAEEGLGAFGTFIVDSSIAGVQMLADMGLSVLSGGSMLVPMFIRSMGSGYLNAEGMGYGSEAALAYGMGVGAVEALSEKMFSVFGIANRFAKGAINKEMGERVIDGLVKRMANSPGGKTALNRLFTILFASGSEGLEEVAAGIMEPLIRKITLDHDVKAWQEIDWESALYEGLIGSLLGGLGGAVDLTNTRPTYWKYYRQGIDESIDRYVAAVRKNGLESREALQAAKAVWDGGTRKMNAVAGYIVGRSENGQDGEFVPVGQTSRAGASEGLPITYHQLAALEEARAYGRTDGAQGPSLADSLNPESLGRYLDQQEAARQQERDVDAYGVKSDEFPGSANRRDVGPSGQVRPSSPQGELTETSRDSTHDDGIVRLDTARSAQTRAQASQDVVTSGVKSGEFEAQPQTSQGVADLSGIPESELTQEEKDELAYGSGAVEDLGRYTGLAQRMGAPLARAGQGGEFSAAQKTSQAPTGGTAANVERTGNEDITRQMNNLAGRLQSKGLQSVEYVKADPRMNGMRVGNIIFINDRLTGEAAGAAAMGHEVVHFAGDFDAELINDLIAVMRRQGRDIDGLVESKREKYRKQFAGMGIAWNEAEYDRAYFEEEVAADFIGEICRADSEALDRIAAEEPGLIRRIINALRNMLARITGNQQAVYEQAIGRLNAALEKAGRNENAVRTDDGVRYALTDVKVPTREELDAKPDMPVIDLLPKTEWLGSIQEYRNRVRKAVTERGMLQVPYENDDTGVLIFLSPRSLSHAFNNNKAENIIAVEYLPELIKTAVYTHSEQSENAPADRTTGVYTFFAAARIGNKVRPVKIKVKEFYLQGQGLPDSVKMYLADHENISEYAQYYDNKVLVLDEIEKEEASSSAASTAGIIPTAEDYPSASSTISVRELLDLVKGNAAKYVPQYGQDSNEGQPQPADRVTPETDLQATLLQLTDQMTKLTEMLSGRTGEAAEAETKEEVRQGKEQTGGSVSRSQRRSPDVRFSLTEPVEEQGSLVALHNLDAEKLGKALDLGGFPMPSIAVTKADIPHTNFGDITLVMDKSTVDPAADRRNEVYSADAWTPTFPQTEYEADDEVVRRIWKRFYDLQNKYGREPVDALYGYGNYLEDELNRYGGVAGIIERERDSPRMKMVYLLDKGQEVPGPTVKETVERMDEDKIAKNEYFVRALGEDVIREIAPQDGENRVEAWGRWWNDHGEELERAYREYLLLPEFNLSEEEVDNVMEGMTKSNFATESVAVWQYLTRGPEKITTENDYSERDKVIAGVDQSDYEAWLDDLFAGAEKNKGIYNGRDRYTASGNERSFSATHYAVTLENIARAMAAENEGNSKNVDGFYGVKTLRAGTATTFRSIPEMHALEDRLQHLTEEEAEQLNDALADRLVEVLGRIYDSQPHNSYDNRFIELDRIGGTMEEAAETGNWTPENVRKVFSKYRYKLDDQSSQDISDLLTDIQQMPVNIFEAKPKRAVRFDEVRAAIVPDSTDQALIDRLHEAGVEDVRTYEDGDDASRLEQVNAVPNVRFSLNDDPELERARQQAEYWKQLALKNSDVKDVDKLTRDLMRGYGSRASRSEMSGRMRQLEAFLRSGGSEAEARSTARQMAEDMLNKAALPEDAADSEYHAAFRRYFRTNSISVPEEVKRGWPDGWGRFRKRYFGRLNLKNDGMDVTKIYREASQQWPDLLPSDEVVMRAQDQLETIAEVLDNLEPNLVNPYGSGPEFDAAVDSLAEDIISSLTRTEAPKATAREEARRERIDRSIDELESREEQQQRFIDDPAELIAASRAAKQKQQQAQKIMRTLRLNQQESKLVDSLLSGALTVDQLPDGIDRRGVLQAYRVKMAVREAQAPVDEYNARRRAKLDQDAADLTEHSDEWKDRKSRFGYDRETARRNFQDIAGAAAGAMIDTYVQPIREHEAEKTRMVSRYNDRIKKLKLDTKTRHGNKVSEAYAVQYVGEAEFIRDWLEQMPEGAERGGVTYREAMTMLDEFWRENPNLDKDRIHAAVAEFRSVYDELFAMINEARVVNGYAPIDYRKGYFPHFTSDSADNIIQSLANGLGFGVEVTELPTDIAGTTHLFRPGIQWSGHMLRRTGNETDYNALEGWDRYIPAVANIIYHTEDIQRLRALERTLRHKYSDKTVQDEIERTRSSRELTETQKNSILDELFKRDVTHLNYFVQWLREYTNQLAGKRADLDRVAEAEAGRKLYRIVQKLENRVAANMLGGNISSAMTNFVPLFQAWGNVSTGSMLRAMWDTTAGAVKHDGFRDSSDFLVNRKGYDPIYQTLFDKARNGLFLPFNIVDDFVSETIVRARYYDELKRGHSPALALMYADTFAGEVMADRAVGELPVIFNSKNPFVKVFTMFQVEVNNDLSHFFKDVPRDVKERGIKAVFWAILKYVLGVHIFNDLFEALFGRRVSFDPLEMLNNLVGDATGYELPNGFELSAELIRTGQWPGWEAFENGKGDDFFGDLLGKDGDLVSWLDDLPFISGLLGGGRYPVLSALPDQEQFSAGLQAFADLVKKDDVQENSNAYDLNKMYKAARAPLTYFLPPAFGGQARKIAEGLYAASQGGSYTITKEGERRLQYPVEGVMDIIKASVFGKTATKGGKKWVESDFDTLSVAQTEAYLDLVTGGSDPQFIYDVLHDLKGTERSGVEKAYALAAADLKDHERIRLLDALVSDGQSEKFAAMMGGGLSFRQCTEVYEEYRFLSKKGELKDADGSYVYKKNQLATEFSAWIDGAGYTDEQKEVITEQYKFWSMVPAKAGNYEKFTAAGLSIDNALELSDDWSELKALPGATNVSAAQKIGAAAAAGYLSERDKQNVVRSMMDDEKNADGVSQQTKFDQYIVGYQVPIECYSQYLTQSNGLKGDDLDGDGKTDSGSLARKKLAIIDRLPLQPGQKTALALFATGNAESTIRKYAPWLR